MFLDIIFKSACRSCYALLPDIWCLHFATETLISFKRMQTILSVALWPTSASQRLFQQRCCMDIKRNHETAHEYFSARLMLMFSCTLFLAPPSIAFHCLCWAFHRTAQVHIFVLVLSKWPLFSATWLSFLVVYSFLRTVRLFRLCYNEGIGQPTDSLCTSMLILYLFK